MLSISKKISYTEQYYKKELKSKIKELVTIIKKSF